MKIVSTACAAVLAATAVLAVGPARAHADIPDCNIGFMPNKPVIGVGTIIGSAWASCDVRPEQHEMRLALDIRQGGQWMAVQMISNDKIPGPGRTPYIVEARCDPGMWRVEAEAVGTLHGKPFDFADFSAERIVSVAECARGDR
jgi:hypothetical protein